MTGRAIAHRERGLGLEVALLAAEVNLLEELIAAGILPEGARRQPSAQELRAGVRFAELDRIVNDAAALLARKVERVRDTTLDGLAELLVDAFNEPDPYAILARLDALTDPTSGAALPGLRDVVDEVAGELRDDLYDTGRAGAREALDEARRQGIPDGLLPDVDDLDAIAPALDTAATTHAQRVAKAPAERLLTVAAEAGQRAATVQGATGGDVAAAALDAAEQASRAGTEDLARQAANVTHGLGRTAALNNGPSPREVYASELLDANTCGPCAVVDGRTYASLEDALVDYPGAGGFVGCDGGSRCRGTLVLVHDTEAAPTLDNPGSGPGSPGGPADRTPRGPASPAPVSGPAATAPQLPDPGVPAALSDVTVYPPVDDAGRTAIPAEDLEQPVTTVAPDTIPRDEELARYRDDELDALLVDPDVPYERKLAAADELDQRAAGTRSQVWDEEELDAATLARYEEEREAWERAGGYAADNVLETSTLRKGGRRIDHVRQAWAEELEQAYIRAEDATIGYMVRKERLAEFREKYDGNTAVLFEGPARVAYYYASRELRDYWQDNPRITFAEFAVERGITDAKTLKRAAAAKRARDDAALWGDETNEGRAKRKRANAGKPRRTLTAGERLVLEQKRRDRIKARERKLRAEGGYTEEPEA